MTNTQTHTHTQENFIPCRQPVIALGHVKVKKSFGKGDDAYEYVIEDGRKNNEPFIIRHDETRDELLSEFDKKAKESERWLWTIYPGVVLVAGGTIRALIK